MPANSNTFSIRLASAEGLAFSGDIQKLHVATEMGEIEILPRHTNLIATIGFGKATVSEGNTDHEFIVRHGVVSCDQSKNEVFLQAFACQKQADIKHETLLEYQKYLLKQLENRENLTRFQIQFLEEQGNSLAQLIDVVIPEDKRTS